MFARARWRLTAWYALAFAAVLLLLGGATFIALLRTTDREVDRGIAATIEQWRASAPPLDRLSAADAGSEFDGEIAAEFADVFVLVVRVDGALVANPRRVGAEEFLEHGVFDRALTGDATWDTISEDGVRLRVRIEPLREGGEVRGAILAGRSLAARDREVRATAAVLGGVAAVGLVAALATGWLLAGRALRPLRDAYERQRAFVADASHELRAPLTVIRTASDLLLRQPLDDRARASAEEVRDVAAEAAVLVDDLLTLARMSERPGPERGEASDRPGDPSGDLGVEVAATCDQLAALLERHGSTPQREIAPALVAAPPDELRRVTRALLENVLSHTPAGTPLRVRIERAGERATLLVDDGGSGVPAAAFARVFDRFARLDSARTPGTGAGLGLAIVRALAERRGGTALASQSPLGGLRVAVSWPLARSDRGATVP